MPDHSELRVRIPARVLHLAAFAAKENSRYCLNSLLIRDEGGIDNAASATDGRRLGVVRWKRSLFDTLSSVLIPASVCKAVMRLTPVVGEADEENGSTPEVMVTDTLDGYRLDLTTSDGPVQFVFQAPQMAFPDTKGVIPNFDESVGIKAIGASPKLVAESLKTITAITPDVPGVIVNLPSRPDKPFGFTSRDDMLQLTAIIMPVDCGIADWMPDKTDDEASKSEPTNWREVPISSLNLPTPITEALTEARFFTLGTIADLTAKGKPLTEIPGIGSAKAEKLEAAINRWWVDHPEHCQNEKH